MCTAHAATRGGRRPLSLTRAERRAGEQSLPLLSLSASGGGAGDDEGPATRAGRASRAAALTHSWASCMRLPASCLSKCPSVYVQHCVYSVLQLVKLNLRASEMIRQYTQVIQLVKLNLCASEMVWSMLRAIVPLS
jgi:hypothetical protein